MPNTNTDMERVEKLIAGSKWLKAIICYAGDIYTTPEVKRELASALRDARREGMEAAAKVALGIKTRCEQDIAWHTAERITTAIRRAIKQEREPEVGTHE